MRIALHQPEIAGNVGTILRLAACVGLPVDIIEPCGFAFSDRALARAGMDYAARAAVSRHADWVTFRATRPGRLVLLTTAGDARLPDALFARGDILLFGSEGSGAPPRIHAAAGLRVRIPMVAGERSLNLAVACAMVCAEALRQLEGWPQ